jgi:hypothetical protein
MCDGQVDDSVTICIAAYRPDERFVRTLLSIRDQTHPHVRCNVSIDPSPGHVMPDLPQFDGLRLFEQTTRRGWVGNVNASLATVDTPFFLVLSHDDTLTPDYLAKCVAALNANPAAMAAHGTLRHWSLRQDSMSTDSIAGTRLERIKTFFERRPHLAELAWRGVVRSELLQRGLKLRAKRSDGFCSNTLWVLELLCHGSTINVPGIFYDRYVEADGLSRAYHARSLDVRSIMLADSAACVLDAARAAKLPPELTEYVLNAWLRFLLNLQNNWNFLADEPRSDHRTFAELRPAIARFMANMLLSVDRGQSDVTIFEE